MTDDVFTDEYLAQLAVEEEGRDWQRADLQTAISDAEEALEMARWALVVFESGEKDN